MTEKDLIALIEARPSKLTRPPQSQTKPKSLVGTKLRASKGKDMGRWRNQPNTWRILKDQDTGIWCVFEQYLHHMANGYQHMYYAEFPSGAEAIAAFAAGGR